jgi:hypothetical protein
MKKFLATIPLILLLTGCEMLLGPVVGPREEAEIRKCIEDAERTKEAYCAEQRKHGGFCTVRSDDHDTLRCRTLVREKCRIEHCDAR